PGDTVAHGEKVGLNFLYAPPQNFSPGSLVKPQDGQAAESEVPHSAQKRRPSRLSAWHRGHFTGAGFLEEVLQRDHARIVNADAKPRRAGL
ncbi:MAG: hypothetical protein WEC13_06395, partial [Burkholderiales bacterium]